MDNLKDFKKYQNSLIALHETKKLVEKLATKKIKLFEQGDNCPLDKDKSMRRWQLAKRLDEMADSTEDDSCLAVFKSPISELYNSIRRERKYAQPAKSISFIGKWEKIMRTISHGLSRWREEIKVDVCFGKTKVNSFVHSLTDWKWHTGFENGTTADDFPFHLVTKAEDHLHKVTVGITSNFIKTVIPFFNGGHLWKAIDNDFNEPFVEVVSEKSYSKSTYQYIILHLDDAVTEDDGEVFAHGIKVRKFFGLETYGRRKERKVVPVIRYLAYTGETYDKDKIIGTATSAIKAYKLLKSRIAKDLLKKL